MTYSVDFRCKVLFYREMHGLTILEVSSHFEVGIASVTRWLKRLEPFRKRYKRPTRIDMEALRRDVELYPDAYQYERAARFGVSEKGIGHALRRMGVSYKKNISSSQDGCRRTTYLSGEDCRP